ncbi:hypothetical protein [Flavobacterium sp.]|uniref:hypothetical protein n=1 Tax=Flavobacterium sp. TaxID=239 RepID=UPI0037BF0FB4
MNFTATYTGTDDSLWKNGKTYQLFLNRNSMMVYQAGTTIVKTYRSLHDFLSDFNLIINNK